MNTEAILHELDLEISRLQQVRSILANQKTPARKGRPLGSKNAPKKLTLSPEARAKIAAAQKKRWAAQKKAAK
jgi:hypothetical protein